MPTLSSYKETMFLNVDLDILSRHPLEALVAAFGRKVSILHVGKEGKHYGAHVELARSWDRDADFLIRALARLVGKLPESARLLWNQAHTRDFNVGIHSALKPHSHELRIRAETLKLAASLGANIVVTTYAPVMERRRARKTASKIQRSKAKGKQRLGP